MKFWGFLVVVLLILSGCKSGRTSHLDTSDLIDFDKMADVMVDIYKTEELLKNRNDYTLKDTTYTDSVYTALFSKYNITKKQFKNSYNYYLFTTEERNVFEEAYHRINPEAEKSNQ